MTVDLIGPVRLLELLETHSSYNGSDRAVPINEQAINLTLIHTSRFALEIEPPC